MAFRAFHFKPIRMPDRVCQDPDGLATVFAVDCRLRGFCWRLSIANRFGEGVFAAIRAGDVEPRWVRENLLGHTHRTGTVSAMNRDLLDTAFLRFRARRRRLGFRLAVVFAAPLWIGQQGVRVIDVLHCPSCLSIPWVLVRVVLGCQHLVCGPNHFIGRIRADFQNAIGIHQRGHSSG